MAQSEHIRYLKLRRFEQIGITRLQPKAINRHTCESIVTDNLGGHIGQWQIHHIIHILQPYRPFTLHHS